MISKIKEYFELGFPIKKIANIINEDENKISNIIANNNFSLKKESFSDDKIPTIIELYKNGVSASALGTKFSIDKRRIQKWAKENNILRNKDEIRETGFDIHYFDVIDNSSKAYWLGYIYTKICIYEINNTIIFAPKNKSQLIKFCKAIKYDENKIIKSRKGNADSIKIYSLHFAKKLLELGCYKDNFKFPSQLNNDLQINFIRGLFDFNSEIDFNNHSIKLKLYDDFRKEIENIFIKYYNIDLTNSNKNNLYKILHMIYSGSNDKDDDVYNEYVNFCNKNEFTINKKSFKEIVKIDGIELNGKYVASLSNEEKEILADKLFFHFRRQGWINPSYSDEELMREYDKISKYVPNEKDMLNNNSRMGTLLSKSFCAKSFYNSVEQGGKSAIDAWNDDKLLKKVINNRLKLNWKSKNNEEFNISSRMLIQGMRSSRIASIVSVFKPEIAKYMALKYSEEGDTIGDYSCGFGARMLGAAAAGRKYIGTDPLTTNELEKMRDFLGLKKCQLINSGSEDYVGEENSVDLYWSSPPYGQKEIYSYDKSQANMNGLEYFYGVYWKKTLENVKFMLKPNKWFGLNISGDDRMLQMAVDVFGEIVEKVKLAARIAPTNKSNDNNDEYKYEYIYMFRNIK